MSDKFKSYLPSKLLINFSLIAFGVSFAYTCMTANLSSVFKFLGASSGALPYLWLAAPITGFIIQPIVGQMSDNTYTRFGKRRPYIFFWGVIAIIGFILMPFFDSLLLTVLGIWLIGSSINGCTEGMRALTGDMTTEKDRSQAFALQAGFGGIGAALGSGLPFMIEKIYGLLGKNIILHENSLPINMKLAFIVSGVVMIFILAWSLIHIHEKPHLKKHQLTTTKKKSKYKIVEYLSFFVSLFHAARKMPKPLRKLCVVQLICWVGIFIFWLYLPIALAQNIYGIPPGADVNSTMQYQILFHNASNDTSYYSSIYLYVSVAYSFVLFLLSNRLRLKDIYVYTLALGGIGLCIISFAHQPALIMTAIILFGIMWGGVLVIPSILAVRVIPKAKIGLYLGVLNMSICLPQIIAGLGIGPLYTYVFRDHASYTLFFSGLLVIWSAYLMYRQIQKRIFVEATRKADKPLGSAPVSA